MKNFAEQNSTIGKEFLLNAHDRRGDYFHACQFVLKGDTCQGLVLIRLQQGIGVLVGESTNTKSHSLDSTWANENFVLSRHFLF